MLYLCNYHITRFRLDHRWNRTTMGDNTVTGLVTITVLIQVIAMRIFIAFLGRPDIRSNQQNPGVPKEQTQFYSDSDCLSNKHVLCNSTMSYRYDFSV